MEQEEDVRTEAIQRQRELEFAHTLMKAPEELGVDLCRTDSEPDLVQTICAPNCFSKEVIRMDKKLYQIDVANNRISTLRSLSGTAAMAGDFQALEFLHHTLLRIRRQRAVLFKHADKYLNEFKQDPSRMMPHASKRTGPSESDEGAKEDGRKVTFIVQGDEDDSDLRWELNSLNLSTDSSTESEEDIPTAEELQHLAREIRKTEGTRFKRKLAHRKNSTDSEHMPPPPNPLAHSGRVLLRSHATMPGSMNSQRRTSSASLVTQANAGGLKVSHVPKLPFNLLSLTGQLSWMVSEYIEHDTSTFKWATDLIHSISRMSVTKATWLNVHQQLRETTELLYRHRGRNQRLAHSASAKGEIAWNHLQMAHASLISSESTTVTSEMGRKLLSSPKTKIRDRKLPRLSSLLEKKFHLAYVCDLILWRAHKILFLNQVEAPHDTAKYQLIDFRIRHMQLRLDQANTINWSPELIDWIMCWIDKAMQSQTQVQLAIDDYFCLNELKCLKTSIEQLRTLVEHVNASEFLSEDYLLPGSGDTNGPEFITNQKDSVEPHRHRHYHPHHLHHGQGGHQQDLRPVDADRCSHAYSALVQQVHDSAMARRPLGYFAERALYDIAFELNCPIDWKERLANLLVELVEAHNEWEHLLHSRLSREFYEELFESMTSPKTVRL
ncbi:unnamed protein product [Dicrocoelium dendriticum]|nr:unnamed protein product [Dicrocoelium dendriticum]